MEPLDLLAHAVTWVMKEYVLISMAVFAYLFSDDRGLSSRVMGILFLSMLLSPFLKSLWQIPLDPLLNKEGWAFPSGHMQAAACLWGWIAWEVQKRYFTYCVLGFLAAYASALVYLRYHCWDDILGAVVFAALILITYGLTLRWIPKDKQAFFPATLGFFGIPLFFLVPEAFAQLLFAQGGLWGLSTGAYLLEHTLEANLAGRPQVLAVALFAFAGVFLFHGFCALVGNYIPAALLGFVKLFTVVLWVSYGAQAIVMRWVDRTTNDEVASGLRGH